MKLTTLSLAIYLLFVSIEGYAQQVSFSGNNVRLEVFFSAITKQTGYVFFYNADLIAKSHPVSLHFQQISLETALESALNNQELHFEIQGRTIFLTKKEIVPKQPFSKFPASSLHIVHGQVVDRFGSPVIGASVYVEGTKKEMLTNLNGDFNIKAYPSDNIAISSIGFKKVVVNADNLNIPIVLEEDISPLAQVIVGGNLFAVHRKTDPNSLTVIDSKTLDALPVINISEIYRGLVPGTNSYSVGDQTQEGATLTIRGAGSENSVSQIDVYVDGIEYAGGSGYLATLNKENIDRVEVVRGPGASTLYGTGSNGGIVQVFTKNGVIGQSNLNFTAGAGFIESKWVHSNPFQQYYSLDKSIGMKKASLMVGGTFQSNGAWLPGGGERTGTIHLGLKWNIGTKLTANFIGYYAGTNRGKSRDPAYDTCIHPNQSALNFGLKPTLPTNKDVLVESYFTGLNLSYKTTTHWTNNLTAGYSQNGNREVTAPNTDAMSIPTSFYHSVNKTTTIRYTNFLKLGNAEQPFNMNLTSGVEFKKNFYQSIITGSPSYVFSNDPPNENYGVFVQANPSYKNFYLTAGLRYEYNKLFKNNGSVNPRLGLTTNFTVCNIIVKPRISWGSGITAPSYDARYGYPSDGSTIGIPNPDIKPQQQQGFDYGLEFYDRKNRFNAEIVYYDNLLNDMIVDNSLPPLPNGILPDQQVNVGAITNRGWEFSGVFKLSGRFSVSGSFSIMHSIIKDSTGDYLSTQLSGKAPGFELKNLPIHTAGLFMNYRFFKLFGKKDRGMLSLNLTEVDGVYALDLVKYTIDLAYGRTTVNNNNFAEGYWTTSGTVFKLGLNIDYYLTNSLRLFIQGSNILNNDKYEQNSNFPTYGASWLFGIKYSLIK